MNQPSGLNIVDDSADFLSPLDDNELANDFIERTHDDQKPGTSQIRLRRRSTSRSPSVSSQEEDEAVTRERKKRKLNEDREARLQLIAMREEREQEESVEQKEAIEIDREEFPNAQTLALMSHTLTSLRSAVNPQVLEMRIMTHHAQDERFGFLRSGGRWHEVWQGMKGGTVGANGKPVVKEEKTKVGLGGLAGDYGDSESDEEEGVSSLPPLPTASPPPSPPRSPPPLPDSPPPPSLPTTRLPL